MPKTRTPLFFNGVRVFIFPKGQLLDYFFSGLIIFIILIHKTRLVSRTDRQVYRLRKEALEMITLPEDAIWLD